MNRKHSPVQVLPSLTALMELDVSSNKEAGGIVHLLVSALPLMQMRQLPLNSCSLNEESFTALGKYTQLNFHLSGRSSQANLYL